MSRILILSRHSGVLDRRIIAEMNTLAMSGREITFVSVPTTIPEGCLDSRVRVVILPSGQGGRGEWYKSIAQSLPTWLRTWVRAGWYRFGQGPVRSALQYFMQATPREPFTAIHCHDLDTLPVAVGLRAQLFPQAQLIYDAHELFPFQFTDRTWQRYWLAVETEYIRQANLVITVNMSMAEELGRRYGIAQPAVIYNSYGVFNRLTPISEAVFLQHFGAPAGGFRVLFQGQLVNDKGLRHLVRAFRELAPSLQLFLLGGGPLQTPLQKLCQRLRIGNVFFGAWVPQADLLRYVAHANLGIIPYSGRTLLNNRYCTPNKLFEFIEAEIPICANDLPELRRIVTGNGIGAVSPMEDAAAMARAVEACRQQCVQGSFTPAALRQARHKFAWEKQAKTLLQLYEQLGV